MPKYLKSVLIAAAVSAVAIPAHAATYVFEMIVTESNDANAQVIAPEFDLPDVGTLGTVTIDLDSATLDADGDPLTGVNAPAVLSTALAGASANFGGLSVLPLTDPTWFGFPGEARLSNTSFASITIGLAGADCSALLCTMAGSFRVVNAAYATPTTFAEVEAMLADPTSGILFGFNGTAVENFVSFEAERTEITSEVPLPASGLLLLAGIAFAGIHGRRHR